MSAGREAERRLNTETRAMPHVRLYIQYTQTINEKKKYSQIKRLPKLETCKRVVTRSRVVVIIIITIIMIIPLVMATL